MKLVYLYIRDFPPFQNQQFNFDSEIRCSYAEDEKTLIIEKGVALPRDFFRVSPRENPYSRMTVSAVVGENGSGKTSLARFFQALCFDDKKHEFIMAFETDPRELWIWYHLPGNLRVDDLGYPGHVNDPIEEMPERARMWTGCLGECFTVVYYSPHYSPGAMSMEANEHFVDLSTAGKMERAYHDFGELEEGNLSLHRDEAYKIVETRRLLAFMKAYRTVAKKELPEDLELPMAQQVIIKQNTWSRQTAIAYCRKQIEKKDPKTGDGDISEKEGWRRCLDLLEYDYAGDSLLNMYATFCGDYWRNTGIHPMAASDDARFGRNLFEVCRAAKKDCLSSGAKVAHARLIAALNAQEKVPYSLRARGYPRDLDPSPLFSLFNRLKEILGERQEEPRNESIALDINGDQGAASVLSLVELHARAKIYSDFMVFEIAPHLSAGQQAFLSLFARLYEYFEDYRELVCDDLISPGELPDHLAWVRPLRCGHLIFLDEVETSLQPGWQRWLVWYVLWFFEHFQKNESVHVVFFSHSPNLLSDIPRGNVCFLGKEDRKEACAPNTFGSNIFDLYKSSFFLEEGPVGEFAKRKIGKALDKLALVADSASGSDGEDEKRTRKLSEESKRTLNLVGDELIRRYLDVWKEMGVL